MGRSMLGMTVFDAAVERYIEQYEQGHRIVVSISGGKDSTIALETAVVAATITGRLPVEAVTRDEEIMFPGTYEYLDRVAQRDEVSLTHLVAGQPIVNAFDRKMPYWWVFDPLLDPDEWVRQPPSYAVYTTDLSIEAMTTKERFPIDEAAGQKLFSSVGLRVQESRGRLMGLHMAGGHITKPHKRTGVYGIRPVYDWTDADVWKAIKDQRWDYNHAYNVMVRHGVPVKRLRIGPPTMNPAGGDYLAMAAAAWPDWWNRVCRRLPSMRTAAQYGKRVLTAERRLGETWQETFQRECIDNAPEWIAERAIKQRDAILSIHRKHAGNAPFPDSQWCRLCQGELGSWKSLVRILYTGDPFSMKALALPVIEPDFFRPGSGFWNGKPSF